MTRRLSALIVGGGPAGAATAIRLGRAGIAAELIERHAEPRDVVCGGFLGWDAIAALKALGVEPARLGARPIRRLRLVARNRSVETALPRAATGLSRRCLDEALLAAAVDAGAQVRRGVMARAGGEDGLVRLDTGEEIVADALFLATGKHELRGLARPVPESREEGAVGLRTALVPDKTTVAMLQNVIELHPFDGGYAGALLQEDGRVNLCMSVAAARMRAAGGISALLDELGRELPRLGDRLDAAAGEPWLTIANVPYGWRARGGADRLYRLGDQAAVIASLAGDGIAIALNSGMAAAKTFVEGGSAADYQRLFAAQAKRPLAIAQGLRWAAERPVPRRLLMSAARVAPGLPRLASRLTRIA